jgi:hypothetical protein
LLSEAESSVSCLVPSLGFTHGASRLFFLSVSPPLQQQL